MSKYSLISFFIALLWINLAIKTLRHNRHDKLNRSFSLVCAALFWFAFFIGIFFYPNTGTNPVIFLKLAYIGGYFFCPLNLHFYLQLTQTRINPRLMILFYLPATLLNLAAFSGHSIFKEIYFELDNVVAIIDFHSIWVYLYALEIVSFFLILASLLLRWQRRSKLNKEKLYARLILILLTFFYLGGLVSAIILPFFEIYHYQFIGIIIYHVYAVGLFYLVRELRFMNLHGGILAEEIIGGFDEMVIVLDKDLKIIEVNHCFALEFKTAPEKVKLRNFLEYLPGQTKFKAKITDLTKHRLNPLCLRLEYQVEGETLITQTTITTFQDRFGDISGFLVISKISQGTAAEFYPAELEEQSKILSKREAEIAGLLCQRLTSAEIASRLLISPRTVEFHMINIYQKLKVRNRRELLAKLAGGNSPKL